MGDQVRRVTCSPVLATAFPAGFLLSPVVEAEVFSNVLGSSADFPAGAVSFADELIDYSPGIIFDPILNENVPLSPYLGAENALGVPDVDLQSVIDCGATPGTDTCNFVSLGVGGSLTVKFTDNVLTGGGSPDADLWIFEAGPQEQTYVDISADGVDWSSLGAWPSFALGIDIDAFGFGVQDEFSYLRLRDDPLQGNTSGITVGLDVDAIGAISTRVVPVPAAGWLLAAALGALATRRRRLDR
ncbi:MAG: PEP-CTERM sorting domain-containing protein [Gammaproteobacteria bacterium]